MCQEMKRVLAPLGQAYDTILLAMGFCGGALDGVGADCRIVVPRVGTTASPCCCIRMTPGTPI